MKKSEIQIRVFCVLCALCALCESSLAETDAHFQKRWLTAIFYSEGATFGDFNKDGKMDAVSGPFIYDGPGFIVKHEYMPVKSYDPLAYSWNMSAFTYDFNGDGWEDIFIIGFPGEVVYWYENPQGKAGHWKQHLAMKVVDNESPMVVNVVGDETPELVCCSDGFIGYATMDKSDLDKLWTFHPVSPKGDYQKFTHGLGVGDVNGDGRMDILEKGGWWEQPEKLDGDPQWKKHAFEFSGPGGAQMYAYDVDGDGDNDVITSLAAHEYGLAWYENCKDGSEITFKQHVILSPNPAEKVQGVQFSQLHALDLVDMDGDGLKDIVTGKRYWAHGPEHDPEPAAPAVLYWFKLVRDGDGKTSGAAHFEAHLIDDNSGVGTQIVAKDANGDGKADVIVGNKKGTMLLLSK